jgi:uncharacterized protein YqjF (DUF2071 family)
MSGKPELDTAYRPWPLPSAPWILAQAWNDLLFAHWPVPAECLRALVPAPLVLEERDGAAWVGVTPFRLTDFRLRWLPLVGRLAAFAELNVRTYVRLEDRPGVFFFSLDASSGTAVRGARAFYRLPYFRAAMSIARDADWFRCRCRRLEGAPATFEGRYRPVGEAVIARPGTIEHFLTERYCLYAVTRRGRVLRAEIHHAPWALRAAEAEIGINTMALASGIALPDPLRPPLVHFAHRQETLVWAPTRAGASPGAGNRGRPARARRVE